MEKKKTFLVVGGDLRQIYLAELLSKYFDVYAVGFDRNVVVSDKIKLLEGLVELKERVEYIVLPLPASNNGVMVNAPYCKQNIPLSGLNTVLKEGGIVFAGKLTPEVKEVFSRYMIESIDYLEREELSVLNAVPTAEGAIQIAMEETATTIYGQKVLITGFGRITKVLIKMLRGIGADVTITARKYSDLAWAEIEGCKSINISNLDSVIGTYDMVINTVPAVLLDEKKLKLLKPETLVIDLASKPGGAEFAYKIVLFACNTLVCML